MALRPAPLPLALASALALASLACDEPERTVAAATAGLVVLAGEPGAATLTIHAADGTARSAPVPDPATAWVSAGLLGTIIATLDDGTLSVSDPTADPAARTWRRATTPDSDVPQDPLFFGTWSPNGRRVAAIASDFGEAGRLTVVLVDPSDGATLLLPVPRHPLVAAPTWIDDDLLLVQTAAGLTIVDTRTGDVGNGPDADLGFGLAMTSAASADLVAYARAEGGAVEIRARDEWLVGGTAAPVALIEREAEVGAIALDASGERLAIVWQQPDGPGTLATYRAVDGWREAANSRLPGESARAVVSWLPTGP